MIRSKLQALPIFRKGDYTREQILKGGNHGVGEKLETPCHGIELMAHLLILRLLQHALKEVEAHGKRA